MLFGGKARGVNENTNKRQNRCQVAWQVGSAARQRRVLLDSASRGDLGRSPARLVAAEAAGAGLVLGLDPGAGSRQPAAGALRPGCLRGTADSALLAALLALLRRLCQCCQQADSQAPLGSSGSSVSGSAGRTHSLRCCPCSRGWASALCGCGGCCGDGIAAAGAHGRGQPRLRHARRAGGRRQQPAEEEGSTGMMRLAASKQQEWWGNRGRWEIDSSAPLLPKQLASQLAHLLPHPWQACKKVRMAAAEAAARGGSCGPGTSSGKAQERPGRPAA